MPKNRRSSEEINAIRENIMNHALELIILEGYDDFSMRKLGARLNIAAKTIYNYNSKWTTDFPCNWSFSL